MDPRTSYTAPREQIVLPELAPLLAARRAARDALIATAAEWSLSYLDPEYASELASEQFAAAIRQEHASADTLTTSQG